VSINFRLKSCRRQRNARLPLLGGKQRFLFNHNFQEGGSSRASELREKEGKSAAGYRGRGGEKGKRGDSFPCLFVGRTACEVDSAKKKRKRKRRRRFWPEKRGGKKKKRRLRLCDLEGEGRPLRRATVGGPCYPRAHGGRREGPIPLDREKSGPRRPSGRKGGNSVHIKRGKKGRGRRESIEVWGKGALRAGRRRGKKSRVGDLLARGRGGMER